MAANRSQTMMQALNTVWSRGGVNGFYQGLIPWVCYVHSPPSRLPAFLRPAVCIPTLGNTRNRYLLVQRRKSAIASNTTRIHADIAFYCSRPTTHLRHGSKLLPRVVYFFSRLRKLKPLPWVWALAKLPLDYWVVWEVVLYRHMRLWVSAVKPSRLILKDKRIFNWLVSCFLFLVFTHWFHSRIGPFSVQRDNANE
jgi:hypothetical protein